MNQAVEPRQNSEWFKPIEPYPEQWEIYDIVCNHIRKYDGPAFVYASVSSGKTIMQAMIAKHVQQIAEDSNKKQLRILCQARTGELVEQNAEEMWGMRARNSIFSASVGLKETKYPVIVGSEGTIARALEIKDDDKNAGDLGINLRDMVFDIYLLDECHQLPFDDPNSQGMKIVTWILTKNPKCRIIGYTGSPWRGTEAILGKFWKKELYNLSMWTQVELGRVHRPIFGFGHDDVQYDFSDIKPSGNDGNEDFSKEQLNEMQKRILANPTVTQKIMLEVVEATKNRNCVLITCSGSKHIKECAAALPEGSYATITEKTTYKERKRIKEGCNNGSIKFVLQIGCWTVGVNIPPIDTIVILRKIGSLTLLTQLVGRGVRLLKQYHLDLGMTKSDVLCLDYAGTFESLSAFFEDELLEAAEFERAKRKEEFIECPRCHTMNGKFARRCKSKNLDHELEADGRCGFFWSSKVCPSCNTENDKVARSCRACDCALVDPNANLMHKPYTDSDYKPVQSMEVFLTKDKKGLLFKYFLPADEVAIEIHYPQHESPALRKLFYDFVVDHCHRAWHPRILNKPALTIYGQKAVFDVPTHITHRQNAKGKSVISRKRFLSGREAKNNE